MPTKTGMEIVEMFKSKWCWLSMVVGIAIGIWMAGSFVSWEAIDLWRGIVVLAFLALFPVSLSCNIRLLVKRWREAKVVGGGILHSILYILGFTALQSCFVGGFCGVSLGTSLLFLLPSWAAATIMHNSVIILLAIDLFLAIGLAYMKCFDKGGLKLNVA